MTEIRIRDIAAHEYAAFLADVPHSIFHGTAWLDAVAGTFDLRLRLLGYFRDEVLLAVTPLMGRRIGPFLIWGAPLRKSGTPPAVPFCSPTTLAPLLLRSLREWVARERLGFVQITVPGDMSAESSKSGESEPLDNLELDLQPAIEETWKSLSELPRRCVRKAVRMGVRIHWRSSEAMLATQEELVSATYDRQGIRPNIPQRLYRELLARRKDIGLRVLSATHSGRTVAAIWVLSDTRTCHYWDAASLEDARELNANHLQVWCLIRWAYRRGFKKLDFVGTSSGGRAGTRPGIARFKRSMGGQPVEYRILYWYSPLMHAAFVGYRLANRWGQRLRVLLGGSRATPA